MAKVFSSTLAAFILGFVLSNILYVHDKSDIILGEQEVQLQSNQVPAQVQVQQEVQQGDHDGDHGAVAKKAAAATAAAEVSKNVYKPGAAICAIQKSALRYIDEWVDYHLALGFETIYIYDNSDNFELEEWLSSRGDDDGAAIMNATETKTAGHETETETEQSAAPRIVIKHFPGFDKQFDAYNECGTYIRKREAHEWIAFIDLDEFVVIHDTQTYPQIMDYLNALPAVPRGGENGTTKVGGLALNWELFSFDRQTTYVPKPLTLRFQQKAAETNVHVKAIAKASVYKRAETPHSAEYDNNDWKTIDSNGDVVIGPFNDRLPSDVISLYHYNTKSLEEFKERCSRGRVDSVKKKDDIYCNETQVQNIFNNDAAQNKIFDDSAWKFLKERVPKYSLFFESSTSTRTRTSSSSIE